ncbi:MAG: cob(I)yrinic acid a,c-diamide adenosyltransferase [Spirochaetales bacterium]|nr:cob(I)yrinic acid a,c-diamide adenosyltransferase [Spirochaetales bacterium]
MKKGLFIIYTGNGKGKTTAALGLALRAMGHGLKVCMIQFIKARKNCGEHKIKNRLGDLYTYHVMGKGFIFKDINELSKKEQEENIQAARDAWTLTKKIMSENIYTHIILDEITYLFSLNLLKEEEFLTVLQNRPAGVHIIVTGRNAPGSFINKADIVTEMHGMKHSYNEGIKAQKGIEW